MTTKPKCQMPNGTKTEMPNAKMFGYSIPPEKHHFLPRAFRLQGALGAFFRSADEGLKSDVITDSWLVIAASCNAKSMIPDSSLRSILHE